MEKYYKAIEAFHEKYKMKGTNNEDMNFRLNLLVEELGELSETVTKGKSRAEFIEENIDLLNLVIGNFVSTGVTVEELDKFFWKKWNKIMQRKIKNINGKLRVSGFRR